MPSRCQIKKIRPLLYSKYPPSSSKSGIKNYVGHREGCHSESYFQNKVWNRDKPSFRLKIALEELTTFPMSNFTFETGFRTRRGVLAIQKWSYFFYLTPGRCDSRLLSNSRLLSSARISRFSSRFQEENVMDQVRTIDLLATIEGRFGHQNFADDCNRSF